MPRGRSTFAKRQKEQLRQQRQKEKALRKNERRQTKSDVPADEMSQLQEHAAAQAALFHVGKDESLLGDTSANDRGEEKNV